MKSVPGFLQQSVRSASFVAWYEANLYARPVFTKMVTGSLLWGIGDAVAQWVPHLAASSSSGETKELIYDWPRTGRAAFFGFAIHAPLSHMHFNFLEWMTVRANVTGLGIPVFKAFMEQFVYWSWFSNSLYHGAMGAMQGQGPQQIYDRIADVLWETQLAQWKFWIPIQLVNFQFTPVRHQLNVVLVTSIVWTALLSAWYPPEGDEKKAEIEETAAHG
jgi:protein Mpv17